MFTQLAKLLQSSTTLNLIVAPAPNNELSVTVIPKSTLAEGLSTPLQLTGKPEDLDNEFVGLLGSYVAEHKSLADQVETTNAILGAAKAESSKQATKALSKASNKSETAKTSGGGGDDENDLDEDNDESGSESIQQEGENSGGSDNPTPETKNEAPAVNAESLWG